MENKKAILIGITGSIAAYKAADLVSAFKKKDWDVYVVMSASATRFITPFTLQVLSGHPVIVDTFDEPNTQTIYHVDVIKKVDVVLMAPLTAHTMGKLAYGMADNMLTNCALVAQHKIRFYAPAMNTNMYLNPLVQSNMERLDAFGWRRIEPRQAVLACGDEGIGALAGIETIVDSVESCFDSL